MRLGSLFVAMAFAATTLVLLCGCGNKPVDATGEQTKKKDKGAAQDAQDAAAVGGDNAEAGGGAGGAAGKPSGEK